MTHSNSQIPRQLKEIAHSASTFDWAVGLTALCGFMYGVGYVSSQRDGEILGLCSSVMSLDSPQKMILNGAVILLAYAVLLVGMFAVGALFWRLLRLDRLIGASVSTAIERSRYFYVALSMLAVFVLLLPFIDHLPKTVLSDKRMSPVVEVLFCEEDGRTQKFGNGEWLLVTRRSDVYVLKKKGMREFAILNAADVRVVYVEGVNYIRPS